MVADRNDLERFAAGPLDVADQPAENLGQRPCFGGKGLSSGQELILERIEGDGEIVGGTHGMGSHQGFTSSLRGLLFRSLERTPARILFFCTLGDTRMPELVQNRYVLGDTPGERADQ